MTSYDGTVFHAARGFLHHLVSELPGHDRIVGELVLAKGPRPQVFWTRNTWLEPFIFEFSSISEAVRILRSIQRNWAPCPNDNFRRTALISQSLPSLPVKPKPFPFEVPDVPMGAFTLLDRNTILASASCTSPFPCGEFEFVEDHVNPPSRAYRKLWEALLVAGCRPVPGDVCLDAGAAPGGWTWALAGLGVTVMATDRAPLDPRIEALPTVRYRKGDAFSLKPEDIGAVDWLCSDVICYPPVLYEWVHRWLDSGLAGNFICTIKMQGDDFDRETVARFAAIPGSRVLHLWHNRHELTWIKLKDAAP